MIVGGLISLLTGLIMVSWPEKSLLFVATLIGAWLLVTGIMRIIQAFTRKDLTPRRRSYLGIVGLLYTIVALICFSDTFTSVTLLTVIVGLVWTIGGAAEIAANFPKPW